MRKFIMIFISIVLNIFSFAQYVTISGKIYDKKSLEPLPGASITILGTPWGTSTDLDGNFKLTNIKKGTYTIVVSYVGYVSDTIKNYQISTNNSFEIFLTEKSYSLNEINVIAQRIYHTETSIINDIKNSNQVINGISSEQISKNQDKNTADILKRLSSITILENRFVSVRGLPCRYNSILFNDARIPSFESDKRSFAFDMIPSGVIERIMVYKTATPDLSGDFSGGLIKIETKKYVDSNYTNVNYSIKYQDNTTFKPFLNDKTSFIEMFGFSGSKRDLPAQFPDYLNKIDDDQIILYAKMLKNKWNITQSIATPDQSLNITLSRKIKNKTYVLTTTGYSNSKLSYTANMLNYNSYDHINSKSDTIYKYYDNIYQKRNNLLIMQNITHIFTPKNILEFKNFINQNNHNKIIERHGINFEEGFIVKNYAFNYQERTLFNSQLSGKHTLNDNNHELTWDLYYSLTINNQPDYRRIRTVKNIDNIDVNLPYQVVIPPSASILDAGRFFSKLNEHNKGINIDYTHRIYQYTIDIKSGIGFEHKSRFFEARWLSYIKGNTSTFDNNLLYLPINEIFDEHNINNTYGFTMVEGTNPSDKYIADNVLSWFYISTLFKIKNTTQIITGIRNEYNIQYLYSRNYCNKPVIVEYPKLSLLPSINITHNINKNNILRLAYFKAINRPEFRELAPFSYYDFQFNNVLIGNEKLKDASIHNIDFKYETYSENNEMFNIGLFYKFFKNAIEMYYIPGAGSGGVKNFTFDNAKTAYTFGVESEIRKSLIKKYKENFEENIDIIVNIAYIKSNVFLGDLTTGQSNNRPLMGQSPYVINTGIYYKNTHHKTQISVIYNVIGKRIVVVGTYGTPDIYEMPKNNLDFVISKVIYKQLKLTCSVNNILNTKSSMMQDSNRDNKINHNDEIISYYKNGRSFNVSISYTF